MQWCRVRGWGPGPGPGVCRLRVTFLGEVTTAQDTAAINVSKCVCLDKNLQPEEGIQDCIWNCISVIPMWVASDSGGMDQWSETKCNYPITTEKCNGVMCNCSPPIFHLLTASVGGCQTVTWSNGDISKMRIVQLRLVILYNILQYHPPSLYLICIMYLYTASMLSFCLIIH